MPYFISLPLERVGISPVKLGYDSCKVKPFPPNFAALKKHENSWAYVRS
jgi:hypothetical protein